MQAFTPELELTCRGDRCQLTLAGVTYGNGTTLQEAGNDLLVRLLDLALALRAGLRTTSEAQLDPHVAGYLWEIGELAIHGGDIRARVFGTTAQTPAG